MTTYEVVLDIDGQEQRHQFGAHQRRALMAFWRNLENTKTFNKRPVFSGQCFQYEDGGKSAVLHSFGT